jgi:hypothetical protein
MRRQPVVSSNIRSVGYEDGEMHIQFANGSVYGFDGPRVEEHYNALIKAASPGGYFASQIRSDPQTKSRRLAVIGYTVLRADRGAAGCPPAGTQVYRGRDAYGCANDDTRNEGIDHVACSVNPSGEPFFTIPLEDLEPIYG